MSKEMTDEQFIETIFVLPTGDKIDTGRTAYVRQVYRDGLKWRDRRTNGIALGTNFLTAEEFDHAVDLALTVERAKGYVNIMLAAKDFNKYMEGARCAQVLHELQVIRDGDKV